MLLLLSDGLVKCMEYKDNNRGKIQFRERAKQIIDFSGLRYGLITPTDIDGVIEYHDKAYIFLEFKLFDREMPDGQRLALERICDGLEKSGKECAVFLCIHNVSDCNKDISAANSIVRSVYWRGKWIRLKNYITVKEQVDKYIEWVDKTPF